MFRSKLAKSFVRVALVLCSFLFVPNLLVGVGEAPAFAEELRMMVWKRWVPEKHVKAFRQLVRNKYGTDLKITIRYLSEPDELYKALRKGEVDIVPPPHNIPKDPKARLIRGKLVLPVNLDNIPNYKNLIPALQKADYITEDGQVYGIPLKYGCYGLAYNTGRIKNAPKSWNILWEPEYAGKYTIISDYYEINIFTAALAMGIDKSRIGRYDAVRSSEFFSKLKYLVKNAKSLWLSSETPDDLQGLPLSAALGYSFKGLKERGEIWKMADPKEGTTCFVDNFMISHTLMKKPELKRIAEEWFNYVIGPDFQTDVVVRTLSNFPVNISIKDQLTPEEVRTFHLDNPNYFNEKLIPWPILDSRSRKAFRLIWEKAGH